MWASLSGFLNQANNFCVVKGSMTSLGAQKGGKGHREGTNASTTLILHMSSRRLQSADSRVILDYYEGPVSHCCNGCLDTILDPWWDVMQELQKSRKHKLVVTLELPSFPHAVLYNQTIVGPRHAGAFEDPSSPSASLLPLYDPEVNLCELHCHWTSFLPPPTLPLYPALAS